MGTLLWKEDNCIGVRLLLFHNFSRMPAWDANVEYCHSAFIMQNSAGPDCFCV